MKNRPSALHLASASLVVAFVGHADPAFAQDKGKESQQPSSPSGSVPSGTGGAVIVPANPQPAHPAASKASLPRPLNYAPPEYPPAAEKQGLEGSVTLELDIDRNGKV